MPTHSVNTQLFNVTIFHSDPALGLGFALPQFLGCQKTTIISTQVYTKSKEQENQHMSVMARPAHGKPLSECQWKILRVCNTRADKEGLFSMQDWHRIKEKLCKYCAVSILEPQTWPYAWVSGLLRERVLAQPRGGACACNPISQEMVAGGSRAMQSELHSEILSQKRKERKRSNGVGTRRGGWG